MDKKSEEKCQYCGHLTDNPDQICNECYEEAKVIDIETGKIYYNFDLLK